MSIGVPIKLLYEAENYVVTVEVKTGEMFRGFLISVEDTMNVRLDDVYVVTKEGKQYHLDQVYLRGNQIRFVVIPDMLRNAPMIKKVKSQVKTSNKTFIIKEKIKPNKSVLNKNPGKIQSVNL